jgi:hypothetical protein
MHSECCATVGGVFLFFWSSIPISRSSILSVLASIAYLFLLSSISYESRGQKTIPAAVTSPCLWVSYKKSSKMKRLFVRTKWSCDIEGWGIW